MFSTWTYSADKIEVKFFVKKTTKHYICQKFKL